MEEVALAGVFPKRKTLVNLQKKNGKKNYHHTFSSSLFCPFTPLLLFKARRDKCLSCIAFRELGRPKVRFFFARLL